MTTKQQLLSDQLRFLIDQSGMSRYQIAKETKIDQATLSRFMSGDGGLSVEKLDAIGTYLNLSLVQQKSPSPRQKKGK